MAQCRDCKLYDLDAVHSKSGAVLNNRVAKCLCKSKEVFPDSVAFSFSHRPVAGSMRPNDGGRCPRFIKGEDNK